MVWFTLARMEKYVRKKCRGGGTGPAPAVAVAAVASAPAPKRPRKAAQTRAEVEAAVRGREDGEACCYLQLRSRKLFMVAAEAASTPAGEEEEALPAVPSGVTASVEAVAVAGVSRCSSTASSVHVVVVEEARKDSSEESSVSDEGCGRQWREATPSSRASGDLSDQESSKAADDDSRHHRRRSSATATVAVARMPPAEEIDEFFAAAEKAEAERFAAKYNFDVVRGVPMDTGRFEWTPVASG